MKKGLLVALAIILMSPMLVSADGCDLDVAIINQDPYPAVPGDYVKVVFQVNGTETTECEKVFLELKPEFPFSLESDESRTVILGGTYISGYESYLLRAFKLVVDEETIEGDHSLEVEYGYKEMASTSFYKKEFDIYVEDARTDFEVFVQEYDRAAGEVTFGIVNVGESDIESLTLEVPQQENLDVQGSSKVVIGSLNSNDDTTATIDGIPEVGELVIMLHYNDQVNVRRTAEIDVFFSQDHIEGAKADGEGRSGYFYLFWILVITLVGWKIYRHYKGKKQKTAKTFILNRNK